MLAVHAFEQSRVTRRTQRRGSSLRRSVVFSMCPTRSRSSPSWDGCRAWRASSVIARARLFDVDLTTRGSIPSVTDGEPSSMCPAVSRSRELGYVVDDALRRRLFSLQELRRCAERSGPAPGPLPARRCTCVLADRLAGYSPGDSDLETRALRALTRAGLPPPRQQYRMVLAGRKVRIDLAYPEQRIAIELDGWDPHRFRSSFDADHARRDDLLVAQLVTAHVHRGDDGRVPRVDRRSAVSTAPSRRSRDRRRHSAANARTVEGKAGRRSNGQRPRSRAAAARSSSA